MNVGEQLKFFRKKSRLTQKALGEMMGVSSRTIQRFESGDVEPNLETLEKIADVLGCELVDLLGWGDYYKNARASMNKIIKDMTLEGMDLSSFVYPSLGEQVVSKEIDDNIYVEYIKSLIYYFDQLNSTGQKKAVDSVELLSKVPEYRRDWDDKQ